MKKRFTVPKVQRVKCVLNISTGETRRRYQSPVFLTPAKGDDLYTNAPPLAEWEELPPEEPFDWSP
jgi:hypothetical protein